MTLRIVQSDAPLTEPAVVELLERLRAGGLTAGTGADRLDVESIVRDIVEDVRSRGDQALVELERKLDNAELTPKSLRVPAEAIQAAHAAADPEFLRLIRRAAENIRRYQESILIKAPPPLRRGGRTLAVRYTPIDRVGVYIPGGTAVLASSVLMILVPARVAGVGQIALASPPRSNGDVSPLVLALAGEMGLSEVYRLGGAAAIAALALGTEQVKAVDKIFGPGNAFVTEAKRRVFGRVGIDSLAGPSEVLIIADQTARADWIAADLLAQAEHNPGSAVLVTPSRKLAEAVVKEVDAQLPSLSRCEATAAGLEAYSLVIVTADLDQACEVANAFASEHLQIITADEEAVLGKITNAGAIFLGPETPVPLGDYYAGPSHVLPTGGTARFFGALSCNDFLKASSLIRYDADALAADAADVADFARREGLTAHARAVEIRTEGKG